MSKKLVTPITLVEVAAASVAAAYGGSNLISKAAGDTRQCIKCEMRNDTDAAVYITNDGSNNTWYLDVGEARIVDDALFNDVRVKRFSGAPTAGSVRFTFYLE